MEKVLLVEKVAAEKRLEPHMPAGLLGIEELDRAEIEAILARAKDFQPHAEPVVRRSWTRCAAR